jgi:hypothetical protein
MYFSKKVSYLRPFFDFTHSLIIRPQAQSKKAETENKFLFPPSKYQAKRGVSIILDKARSDS